VTDAGRLTITGRPTGAPPWRQQVARLASPRPVAPSGVELSFTLPVSAWVDLDTLAENTLAGLRDAGALPARYAGLDALIATKQTGPAPGASVVLTGAGRLRRRRPPGTVECEVATNAVPRPGNRAGKRSWRDKIAAAWGAKEPLTGDVWADVDLGVSGSLLGPLEVVVDALEPVLGRDPRGRAWQEFFPNDHRITWLRVRRTAPGGLRLRLGAA
jgi:hypothetical protein